MRGLLYKVGSNVSKSTRVHILCWSIFIVYEVQFSVAVSRNLKPLEVYILFYLLNISLFYFHSGILLKKFSVHRYIDILRIPLLVVLEITAYCTLTFLITQLLWKLGYEEYQSSFLQKKYIMTAIWRGIYFILYGTGYYFLLSYYQKKEKSFTQAIENEKLTNDLLRAEQDFLRAQINPHLLFNTLSFIKYAAKRNPAEADEAMMRLSGIMSFALESNSDKILLSKELDQVQNIIGLNQLRFNHKLNIKCIQQMDNPKVKIIPIVLLTTVENLFKHGNLQDENEPAQICVEATNEYIIIKTCNLPNRQSDIKCNHTGLANINMRLNHAYSDHYEFEYGMADNLFKVYIKINKLIY